MPVAGITGGVAGGGVTGGVTTGEGFEDFEQDTKFKANTKAKRYADDLFIIIILF